MSPVVSPCPGTGSAVIDGRCSWCGMPVRQRLNGGAYKHVELPRDKDWLEELVYLGPDDNHRCQLFGTIAQFLMDTTGCETCVSWLKSRQVELVESYLRSMDHHEVHRLLRRAVERRTGPDLGDLADDDGEP